jgi:uncharacterized membrane protein YdbT with pleckstrin-like domain
MGYVEEQLLPGERVHYYARLHRLIFAWPAITALAGGALGGWAAGSDNPVLGAVVFGAALVPLILTQIRYRTSEFAVTDRRVIIKVGWIRRRTLETMLSKIEAVGVEQGIVARMLGFGTITITGTGGTREPFANISRPLEFRRQVQAQIGVQDVGRGGYFFASDGAREERDCPFCAERILARAKVCKHCRREVIPLAPA